MLPSNSLAAFDRFAQRSARLLTCAALCLACSSQAPQVRLRMTPERVPDPSEWAAAAADAARLERNESARAANLPSRVVVASGGELIGMELDARGASRERWRLAARVEGAPILAGELALYATRDEIVAVSAANGARRWARRARGAALLAAAVSGEQTALLQSDRTGLRALVVCDGMGREQLHVVAAGVLGTPALLGNLLFAPFADGNVAAIDVAEQQERSRARLGTQPLHALLSPNGLFFGGPPWIALNGSAAYGLPRRPLPEPVLSSSEPPPARAEGDVTRLYVRPTSTPVADDMYMASYGRVAFGLEREHGSLRWVVALAGRALAAANLPSGLLICDDSGGLRVLARQSGATVLQWQLVRRRALLEEPTLLGCALAPGRWASDADELASASRTAAANQPALLEQLARVLSLSDRGLSDAQRFLSRELAARPEPEATRVLVDLVTRRSLDRVLQSEAEDLLAIRRNGQDYMLAALATGTQDGDATALPPIAPLGEALAALGERRAAPLLARQLNRPAHTAPALARAAAALEQLASEAEYDELSVFFSLHRTSADSPELVAAVVSVGKTLLRVSASRAQRLVRFALRDPLTTPDVRSALDAALREAAPANVPAAPGGSGSPGGAPGPGSG